MDPPRYRAGTVTKTASRRWRGRLKSDFHTGLCLCLWCLCSSSEPMVVSSSMWGSLSRLPPPRPLLRRPPRSDRWTASEAPGCRRASDRCLMAALCFAKISEFGTRGEPKHAFGRADWRCERKEKVQMAHLRRRASSYARRVEAQSLESFKARYLPFEARSSHS